MLPLVRAKARLVAEMGSVLAGFADTVGELAGSGGDDTLGALEGYATSFAFSDYPSCVYRFTRK